VVVDETAVSLLDRNCQKQWFHLVITGNFIDDASSYMLNGIQFYKLKLEYL